MAELKKHVLGVPTGKVGDSVCFSTWRGKATIKSIASSIYDPKTPTQLSNRMKFGLLGHITRPLAKILEAGYKDLGRYGLKAMTPQNAFVKYNIGKDDTFSGQGPDEWEINYEKLAIAQGGLTGFSTAKYEQVPLTTDNNVVFTWTSDESTDENDQVYCVLYNEGLNLAKFTTATRADGTVTTVLRDEWIQNGNTHIYMFAFNGKKASCSEYLGYIS